jgi:hypothetical protein
VPLKTQDKDRARKPNAREDGRGSFGPIQLSTEKAMADFFFSYTRED